MSWNWKRVSDSDLGPPRSSPSPTGGRRTPSHWDEHLLDLVPDLMGGSLANQRLVQLYRKLIGVVAAEYELWLIMNYILIYIIILILDLQSYMILFFMVRGKRPDRVHTTPVWSQENHHWHDLDRNHVGPYKVLVPANKSQPFHHGLYLYWYLPTLSINQLAYL